LFLFSLVRLNGKQRFYSIFPELGHEVFEKPLELYLQSNVICMNSLNTVIANTIEKSKLGEAGFHKHDIFSSPGLVETFALMIFYLPYVMILMMFMILVPLKYL
jgi:hypothetical protein